MEGKEHKLVRIKQHRVFNLRCLKENIVPKGVKINYKQFKPIRERKVLCKTHCQILNSRVRCTNTVIDTISKDIDTLRSTIQKQVNSLDFNSITEPIYSSKANLFKKVKKHQVRKFNKLQDSPAHRNIAVPECISKKWVINLASKDLSQGEVKLLQRGPKSVINLVRTLMGSIAVNTTKKLRIYSKTTNKSGHPILTSPKRKRRPSKPSKKMTHR